jgi:hypothetical protein
MPSDLFVRRIKPDEKIDFRCCDGDLTDFFQSDCLHYLRELLAVTYAIEFQGRIIAMFSLCNDRLDVHDFSDNAKKLKQAARDIPHPKRGMKHFPAVKIARLAVENGLEKKGLGRAIVVFIQVFFLLRNKTGCRFLTVDSYPDSIGFYEKVGFRKVAKKPEDVETNDHVLMYLDLVQIVSLPHIKEIGSVVNSLIGTDRAEFTMPA